MSYRGYRGGGGYARGQYSYVRGGRGGRGRGGAPNPNADVDAVQIPDVSTIEAVKVTKDHKKRPTFSAEILLPNLEQLQRFSKLPFKGKNYEAADLRMIVHNYQKWAHSVFPKMQLVPFIDRVEKTLGVQRVVRDNVDRLRQGLSIDLSTLEDDSSNFSNSTLNTTYRDDMFDNIDGGSSMMSSSSSTSTTSTASSSSSGSSHSFRNSEMDTYPASSNRVTFDFDESDLIGFDDDLFPSVPSATTTGATMSVQSVRSTNTADISSTSTTPSSQTSSSLTPEIRERMERNRLEAIRRRQAKQNSGSASESPSKAAGVSGAPNAPAPVEDIFDEDRDEITTNSNGQSAEILSALERGQANHKMLEVDNQDEAEFVEKSPNVALVDDGVSSERETVQENRNDSVAQSQAKLDNIENISSRNKEVGEDDNDMDIPMWGLGDNTFSPFVSKPSSDLSSTFSSMTSSTASSILSTNAGSPSRKRSLAASKLTPEKNAKKAKTSPE